MQYYMSGNYGDVPWIFNLDAWNFEEKKNREEIREIMGEREKKNEEEKWKGKGKKRRE